MVALQRRRITDSEWLEMATKWPQILLFSAGSLLVLEPVLD